MTAEDDPRDGSPGESRKAAVLLVDDRRENLLVLDAVLEPLGQRLVGVTSGEAALDALEREDFAVVLLDLMMPGLDGLETASRMRLGGRGRHTPIIFVTASDATPELLAGAYARGAVDYIVKPFNPSVLRAKVAVFVELFLRGIALQEREAARAREQAAREVAEAAQTELEAKSEELAASLALEAKAKQEAEAANRLKDEFLATVSHELRTPLSAIVGWASMLRARGGGDPAVLARGLDVIERNARAQARLIEDILDVSRIVTGKLRLEPDVVDLRELVQDAVESVRPSAEAKRVDLRASLAESSCLTVADFERLRQVVCNLLSNAIKFTPEGGRIGVALERRDGSFELRVEDSGKGIDRAFLPHVFDRFRQEDGSSTRAESGLGLGLAIVRYLVEVHGGTTTASSEGPRRGATFTVRLPIRPVLAAPSTEPYPRSQRRLRRNLTPVLSRGLAGTRILVVEDDPDAREIIATVLSGEHAIVHAVPSAEEALAAITSFVPDVLVSDIGMPGHDGYWLLERVRRDHPDLPAIALTAYSSGSDAERALAAGFRVHLAKPVEPLRLVAAIDRVLERDGRMESG